MEEPKKPEGNQKIVYEALKKLTVAVRDGDYGQGDEFKKIRFWVAWLNVENDLKEKVGIL